MVPRRITIRLANDQDIELIRLEYKASNNEMGVNANFTKRVLKRDLLNPIAHYHKLGGGFYIAEFGGETAGFMGVIRNPNNTMEVQRFVVLKKYRRMGVGKTLLTYAKTLGNLHLTCMATNETARRFYAKHMCFHHIEKRRSGDGKSYYTLLHYATF